MNTRVVAAVAAIVLALIGAGMFVVYAATADKRAQDGAKLVDVVQATEAIPAGTDVADLGSLVKKVRIPQIAVVDGAVHDLSDLEGLATTVDLKPGDQLIESRFAKNGLVVTEKEASLPRGLQEMTIQIPSSRVVGAIIKPGDLVGILGSYGSGEDGVTKLVLHRILVLRITKPTAANGAVSSGDPMVTLAVDSMQAARVVNVVEFGKLYLTKQNANSDSGKGVAKILTKSDL